MKYVPRIYKGGLLVALCLALAAYAYRHYGLNEQALACASAGMVCLLATALTVLAIIAAAVSQRRRRPSR